MARRALLTYGFCLLALAVTTASARSCPNANATSATSVFPSTSTCPDYNTCGNQLCTCIGSSDSDPNTCFALASSSTTCSSAQQCLSTYMDCVHAVTALRLEVGSACQSFGASLYLQELTASVGMYQGSTLQQGCTDRVCLLVNQSATLSQCDFGVNDSNICTARRNATAMVTPTPTPTFPTTNATVNVTTALPATTIPPASTLPASFVAILRATIRIRGTAFALLLNDPTRSEELRLAVTSDLAGLLEILARFIEILNMYEGSLVVDFAVDESAGVSAAQLNTNLQRATTTNWMNSTQGVYSQVSNETLTAEIVSVFTAAPTTTAAPDSSDTSNDSSGATPVVLFVVGGILLLVAIVAGAFVIRHLTSKARQAGGQATGAPGI